MKNSHKLVGIALVVVLTLGTALSLAVNSNSDLTGRVQLTKEESLKLRKEIGLRKENASKQKEVDKAKSPSEGRGEKPGYDNFIGNGVLPDSVPVIETHIGPCNDPFGSPTCVVDGQYTTYDLNYSNDEVVYTMRVKNTSSTTPIYMDKVFLEYYVKGIDQTVWNSRTEWEIYDASAPNTLLTRGRVYNAANVNGYVDFDWSYPGSLSNPINQPPVILPLGTQTYIVTADIVDDTAGPSTFDYVEVRANDSLTFTPVMGGTLADAHSVDSHFIWHTASGLYYNEGYTDLMDMWGGVPNAFAQWRKRMWSAPVVPTPFCGDGIVTSGEQCDDGNTVNGDGCNNSCQYESCGDGYFDFNGVDNVLGSPDDEACDDGNAINGDGCSMTCELESTVTLDIDNTTGPTEVEWTHAGMAIPWYMRSAMTLDITPSAPVTIPNYRVNLNFELETDGMVATVMAPITPTQCANLGTMQTIVNQKTTGFEMHDITSGDVLLSTVTGQINVTGTTWLPGSGIYGDDFCDVDGYVDVNFGGYVFPASTSNIDIRVGHNSERLFPWEEYHFNTVNVPATTTAIDSGGLPLSISQFTGPIWLNGYDVTVDEDRLRVIEPSSSLTPYPMTASQGETDVLFGVFFAQNLSNSLDVTLNEINIMDFISLANINEPDITNIRVYEWDIVGNQAIGAPLASGLSMGASNTVIAQNLNLFFPRKLLLGNIKYLAIVGDISPTFSTNAGFDIGWEGGSHNPDTDTLADNNETHLSVNGNGLTNAMTASPAWNVPFEFMFNQCDTSVGNPYLDGCWTGPFNRVYNLNMTLGNLVDVLPSNPQAMIQFQPLPPGEPYESIIVPTGSGLGNAVKVADVIVHDLGTVAGLSLQKFQFSNDDNVANYAARFGTFYLVEESTGSLIDTAAMMDPAISDGTVTFDGFLWNIPAGGDLDLDVFAEVLPITQAAHSGSIVNLYLANTNPTEIELETASGNDLLPSEITNYANDGDTFQQLHVTRRTKPTITYNNGVISTAITGTVNAKEMYRFSISADPVGPLDWHHVTLDSMETAGISSTDYQLYILGQPTSLNSVAVSAVGGEVTITPDTIQTIPAGTTVDYVLKADISVTTPAVSQSVSNTLTAADDTYVVTDTVMGLAPTTDFVWSDRSSPAHTLLTADWTNGYLVEEFDVDIVNIYYSGTGGGPVSYTRTDLLTDLFSIKGQPLMSGPSGCTDTTPTQEAVWATGINLGIISYISSGLCGPNDLVNRAEASKVLADYAVNVTGTMSLISPPWPTFPDVPTAAWFYTYVESLYNAMGTIYAPASGMFYPGNLLDSVTAVTWITNLP